MQKRCVGRPRPHPAATFACLLSYAVCRLPPPSSPLPLPLSLPSPSSLPPRCLRPHPRPRPYPCTLPPPLPPPLPLPPLAAPSRWTTRPSRRTTARRDSDPPPGRYCGWGWVRYRFRVRVGDPPPGGCGRDASTVMGWVWVWVWVRVSFPPPGRCGWDVCAVFAGLAGLDGAPSDTSRRIYRHFPSLTPSDCPSHLPRLLPAFFLFPYASIAPCLPLRRSLSPSASLPVSLCVSPRLSQESLYAFLDGQGISYLTEAALKDQVGTPTLPPTPNSKPDPHPHRGGPQGPGWHPSRQLSVTCRAPCLAQPLLEPPPCTSPRPH